MTVRTPHPQSDPKKKIEYDVDIANLGIEGAPETSESIVTEVRQDTSNTLRGDFERQAFVPESLIESLVDVAGQEIPVHIESPADADKTLRKIYDGLANKAVIRSEIEDLTDLLKKVSERFADSTHIKKIADELSAYLEAARAAYSMGVDVPKLVTEDSREASRMADEQRKIDEEEQKFKQEKEVSERERSAIEKQSMLNRMLALMRQERFAEALSLVEQAPDSEENRRFIKNIAHLAEKVANYKKYIQLYQQLGKNDRALALAKIASHSLPRTFDGIVAHLSKIKPLTPLKPVTPKQAQKSDRQLEDENDRRQAQELNDALRSIEALVKIEAPAAASAKLFPVIHKEIPQAGTKSVPETKKELPAIRLFIQNKTFQIPREDYEGAKNKLKELLTMVRDHDIPKADEVRLLAFLQAAENAYSGRAIFDEQISEIMNLLDEKKKSSQPVQEEQRYMKADEIARVPVEMLVQRKPQEDTITPTLVDTVIEEPTPRSVPKTLIDTVIEEPKVQKNTEKRMKQAVSQYPLLEKMFIKEDRKKKIAEMKDSFSIAVSQTELTQFVDEYLAIPTVGNREEALKQGYKKNRSLSLKALLDHGITADKLEAFSKGLEEFIRSKKKVNETKSTAPDISVPASAVTPTLTETPDEVTDKEIQTLDQQLKTEEEYAAMMKSIRALHSMSAGLEASRTDHIRNSLATEDNESFKVFITWVLAQKVKPGRKAILRQLIETIEGERNLDLAKAVVTDTLLRLNRLVAAEKKSEAKEGGNKETESVPVAGPERTPMPDDFARAIEVFAKGDESKKERLLNLWEIANDKISNGDPVLTQKIKRRMTTVINGIKYGITPEQSANYLRSLLEMTETLSKTPYDQLEAHFEGLLQGHKYEALRKRLGTVFRILKDDPSYYSNEDDAYSLTQIQEDFNKMMLNEVSQTIGLDKQTDIGDFWEKVKAMSRREKLKAMNTLSTLSLLMTDEQTIQFIEDYERVEKKKASRPAAPKVPLGAAAKPAEPEKEEPKAETVSHEVSEAKAEAVEEVGETEEAEENGGEKVQDTGFESKNKRMIVINAFLSTMGYLESNKLPAVTAMRKRLEEKLSGEDDLDKLTAFLKAGQVEDEVEILAKKDKVDLRKKLIAGQIEISTLDTQIKAAQSELSYIHGPRAPRPLSEQQEKQKEELPVKIGQLTGERFELSEDQSNLQKALEKKAQKQGKAPIKYKSPEHLLGMINLFFAKKMAPKGEEPNYTDVLEKTQEQIQEESNARYSWGHRLLNEVTGGILKPRLKTTLIMLAEKDDKLKGIKPEQMAKLASAYDDQNAVDNWIDGLEVSEDKKMKVVIPTLIGYMENAVNAGSIGKLNFFSLNRGKQLLEKLRRSVHKYAIEQAETKNGTDLEKMSAYFGLLNNINEKSQKVTKWNLTKNMLLVGARNGLIVGSSLASAGLGGAAGWALAGMSGAHVATAAATATTVTSAFGMLKVEKPEHKAILQKIAVRSLAVGGMGALALGTVPWLAIPAMVGGLIVPSLVKNRSTIVNTVNKIRPSKR